MAEKYYKINDFSGGLSDSSLFGGKGSFAEAVGCDIHSEPKIIKPSQALSSGTLISEFCKYALKCSTGTTYYFGGSGTIYSRDSSGSYGTVYADSYGTIIGCGELDSYIYWASTGTLSRIAITDSWTTGVSHNWASLTSADYHQMVVNGLYLFILNKRNIATVDDTGTITLDGTPDVTLSTLPDNYEYTAISNFGDDLIMGTKEVSGVETSRIMRWDTVSPAWNSTDDIPESSINSFITIDNYVLAQAGNQGNLYFYNGSTLEKFKKIQGDYNNKTMTTYPGSVCQFLGKGMLGVSNLYGNPCNQGVYSIGQYDRNYPMALNLDYPISRGSISDIEIGALTSSGTLLTVAWKAGGSCGIDEIDWGSKYPSAYFKTLSVGGDRMNQKTFKEYNVSYKEKPTGTDIKLYYYPNYSTGTTEISLTDKSDYNKMAAQDTFEAGVAQFRVGFTTSGNDAPAMEELFVKWNEKDIL